MREPKTDDLLPTAAPLCVSEPESGTFGRSPNGEIVTSVIIPTYLGGPMLERCLSALADQDTDRPFEVVCIDSGSTDDDLTMMADFGARVWSIENALFNHGRTRDLGAELTYGEVLVFLNQDAIPADELWLTHLTSPLFGESPPAAVQGEMRDFEPAGAPVRPFFWDTCGPRFYFTREMRRWMERYPGPSFSTVCAAIRRSVWRQIPFGWAPFMEDKKWQRMALEDGHMIVKATDAVVFHSHDYTMRSVFSRCRSEGSGWRFLGERYTLSDAAVDLWAPTMWSDLVAGLVHRRGRLRLSEILYPFLRPPTVWLGNLLVQR
jgi:glycosyltransferase involved in cell wall biosynthesis